MSRKLSLDEIAERRILAPGQEYLGEYLRRMMQRKDCPIGIYEHSAATNTCIEKIEQLNKETALKWELRQAIKAPYFQEGDKKRVKEQQDWLYCAVFPEIGKDLDKRATTGLHLMKAREPLPTMEHGTCTPFISVYDVSRCAGRVQRLYVHYDPRLDHQLVDVSVGGKGEAAHRISIWLPYRAMRKLLEWNLGDVVITEPLKFKTEPSATEAGGKSFISKPDKVKTYGG
jgi:hypothetical protein